MGVYTYFFNDISKNHAKYYADNQRTTAKKQLGFVFMA